MPVSKPGPTKNQNLGVRASICKFSVTLNTFSSLKQHTHLLSRSFHRSEVGEYSSSILCSGSHQTQIHFFAGAAFLSRALDFLLSSLVVGRIHFPVAIELGSPMSS